jgi:hypothetical protein
MTFVVNRRDGLYSLQQTARQLCRFITDFAPTIRRLYPGNTELHDALDVALVACSALEALVTAQREEGI